MTLIGIDIGGTKCAVSLGEEDGAGGVRLLKKCAPRPTPGRAPDELLGELAADANALVAAAGGPARALGVSCGGPLDSRRGLVLSPPNLPGWDAVPVCDILQRATGLPAFLCNDANAGALAEWRMGAGRGCDNLAFLTFGTGLGAGLILNGRLYEGACDFAGELGHIRLADDGPAGYGKLGSFEGFCSGGGIAQLAGAYLRREYQQGHHPALCPSPQDLGAVDAKAVGLAAAAGDPLACEIMEKCGQMLGCGLAILIDLLNPQRIIIGSIFARSRAQLWPAAQAVLQRECLPAALAACEVLPCGLTESVGDLAALTVAAYRLGL